jgi:hypothetical protein
MRRRVAGIAICLLPLFCGTCGLIWFIYPFWPYWFSERPMFCHWVGESHTAWGRNSPISDSSGTELYLDKELNLIVIVIMNRSQKGDLGNAPLGYVTPRMATFQVNGTVLDVSSKDKNKLILITASAQQSTFALMPGEGEAVWSRALEALLGPLNDSIRLPQFVVSVYKGPDRVRLIKLVDSLRTKEP